MIYDLDKILLAAAPGEEIRLRPGIYYTMGITDEQARANKGAVLKRGVKLIGQGSSTTVLCVRDGDGPEVSTLFGADGGNRIANLVIDCGVPGSDNKRNGCYFEGADNTIEAVQLMRPWGNLANRRESFGLSVRSFEGCGNRIINCTVLDIQGDYQTAIQGHEISDCQVIFPRNPANPLGFRVSYNVGDSLRATLLGCSARWASSAVYWDWMDCIGLEVKNCSFYGCHVGLHLNAHQTANDTISRRAREITFVENDIWLDPAAPQVDGFRFVHSTPEGIYRQDNTLHSIHRVICRENRVRLLPGQRMTRARFAMNASSFLKPSSRTADLGITEVELVNTRTWEEDGLGWRNFQHNADIVASITQLVEWTPE